MTLPTLRSATTFTLLTLAILGVLASSIRTLHIDSDGFAVLAGATIVHLLVASSCIATDIHRRKSIAYTILCWLPICICAALVWCSIQFAQSDPEALVIPTQAAFLIGASGILNGLGILVYRLHVPA